jgi:transcriptional regulator with XRE-family HTH domain
MDDNRELQQGEHKLTPAQLIAIREDMGLTQAELAERLGKSRNTVINWETGRTRIPADLLAKLTAPAPAEPLDAAKASERLGAANAPQCYFHERIGRYQCYFRNLKHPHWFHGTDSPWRGRNFEAVCTLGDLERHVPPTPEQAKAMLMANGVSERDADRFLSRGDRGGHSIAKLSDSFPPEWKA